ncbi:MAG: hypothetical protein H3C34_01465 [Caldilineaceae bacterium]|nr:hypothetical protein [Caldilineaceae bacterium]
MTSWHHSSNYRLRSYLAMLIVLFMAALPMDAAHGQTSPGQEPIQVQLAATDSGFECLAGCDAVHFDGSPWIYTLEVEESSLVELTFIWQHATYLDESHIMVLDGYKLEWDQIDFYNQEATLRFIADQPGTFTFKCELECHLHDFMQRGHLKVRRTGAGSDGAAALTATALTVAPSSWTTEGETVTLMTLLRDAQGAAVPKAEIHYYLDAEFAGTKGNMEIGRAKTDANGVAFLDFRPTLSIPQQVITARFSGMGIYDESEQTFAIEVTGVPPAAYTVAPVGLEELRRWAPAVLVAVVLGIWAIFGVVVYQLYRIWRLGTAEERNL